MSGYPGGGFEILATTWRTIILDRIFSKDTVRAAFCAIYARLLSTTRAKPRTTIGTYPPVAWASHRCGVTTAAIANVLLAHLPE